MKKLKGRRPSPALLVAVVALVAALGGGAVAGVAVTSLNKKEKKQVKKIAKKQAKKQSKKAVKGIPAGPQGEQGPEGDKGEQGPEGPPGPSTGPAGGDLTGSYPNPTIAASMDPIDIADNPNSAEDPCSDRVVMTLCGTSASRWENGGFGIPGLQAWRDRLGQVHIRGSATIRTGTNTTAPSLFVLEPSLRPSRRYAIPIATGERAGVHPSGSAVLIIQGPESTNPGRVDLRLYTDLTDTVIHLGEVVFRADT